ncbi:MAG: ZIP family metal transporter [Eubacterium sp.]|nr:ZIP family metal transporter [Eubacterium sp.]
MLYLGIFAATLMMVAGGWIFIALNRKFPKAVDILLAASAGLLLGMVFFGILPEAWELFSEAFGAHSTLGFTAAVALGVVFIVVFEKLIPVHHHEEVDEAAVHHHHRDRRQMTAVILLAFGFHSLFELLSILVTGGAEPALAWGLALVIGLHNIPIGFVISAQMELFEVKGGRCLGLLAGLAAAETALAALVFAALTPWVTPQVQGILLSMTAGIMVYLVFDELLPKVYREEDQHAVNYTVILGILAMLAFIKITGH